MCESGFQLPIMAALHPNPILLPSFCEEKEGYGSAEQAAEAETRPVAHGQNYNTNVQRQTNIAIHSPTQNEINIPLKYHKTKK